MASSPAFAALPLDSPSLPTSTFAPAASSSSYELEAPVPASSFPPLPASGPPTPSVSPPPSSSHSTVFPAQGYTPLNDPVLPKSSKAKGKARAIQQSDGWVDLERGSGDTFPDSEEPDMVREGWERVEELSVDDRDQAAYPPRLNEEEQEEKRIADTLALWKERDLARRRAARESKQLKSSASVRSSGSLSSMPSMRLPGGGGNGPTKRWSLWNGGESPGPSPPSATTSFDLPTSASSSRSPPPPAKVDVPTSFSSNSPSAAFQPGHKPSMSTASADYEYRGREWMGGATKQPRRRRDNGFWESLCGTGRNDRAPGEITEDGSDDDDGDQAGRTNPFE